MNIAQIEYYIELYKLRNFSLAARRLELTQPALSTQIQKLEEELGFKLLDRQRKPLQVTAEGELFYEKALEIYRLMQELKELPFELEEKVEGSLKIGVIPTIAPYLVPLFAKELNEKYPDLRIQIIETTTQNLVRMLKSADLDAGILATPISEEKLYTVPLFYEQFYVYVSEEHELFKQDEVDIKQIDFDDLWYLEEGNCFQNQVNSICEITKQQSETASFQYKSSSIESLRRIVEHKKSMTFIPELATLNLSSEQEEMVKEIVGEKPVREISLVHTRLYTKKRLLDPFREVLLSQLPKRMKQKPDGQILDTKL